MWLVFRSVDFFNIVFDMGRTAPITTFRDCTAKLWDEQYFGETKNELFFKERVFFQRSKIH